MDVGKLAFVAGQCAEFKKNVGKQSLQAFFCNCLVSNICNGYLKLFAPSAVSISYFGYCAVNGAFAPVARRCR